MLSQTLRLFRRALSAAPANHRPKACPLGFEALESREVPALVYGIAAGNVLVSFDTTDPTALTTVGTVTGLGTGETIVGIDFRPRTGELFAAAVPTGSTAPQVVTTYTINPLTAEATLVGATATTISGAADIATGYDFNPTVDRIRYVNADDENARLNPNNGALAGDDTNLTATAEIIAVAYDRNFDRQTITTPTSNSVIPTSLYAINRATGQLSLIGGIDGSPSPNAGAVIDIGALGFTLSATADGGFDIVVDPTVSATLNNNGLGRAVAALTADDGVTRLYDIDLATGTATLIGLVGDGTQEILSIAIVPSAALTVGSGLGANGDARLLDADTGAVRLGVVPYAGFQGGTLVAAGDITGDGTADIVTAAFAPQGHVKVFDGVTGAEVASFFAFSGFQGTVNIGTGDVNADGFDDILVVANGVSGHVKAFSGRDGTLLASFFAYDGFLGNTTISSADFDLDGRAEIITAASINGHVKVFNLNGTLYSSTAPALTGFVSSFFAYNGFLGDVRVAGGDLNGDNVADIALSTGVGTQGHVKVFSGAGNALLASFFAFESGFTGGAFIGLSDFDQDGDLEIAVTPGVGRQADVFFFDLAGAQLGTFPAFANFQGGASIGGARG